MRTLWKRTPPGSVLRKMYVENFITRLGRETFARLIGKYPRELVQEVAVGSLTRLETSKEEFFQSKLESFQELVSDDD